MTPGELADVEAGADSELPLLLGALGVGGDEVVSVCHSTAHGLGYSLGSARTASGRARDYANGEANVWFGVNPVRPWYLTGEDGQVTGAWAPKGRGTADEVSRVVALWADLDVKGDGMPDLDSCQRVIDDLSEMLRAQPVAIVNSGHGLQPYWKLEAGDVAEARELVSRFRRLVTLVADSHGGKIDNVFDVARILRAPGSVNVKGEPVPAELVHIDADAEVISFDDLRDVLLTYGIREATAARSDADQGTTLPDYAGPVYEALDAGLRRRVDGYYAPAFEEHLTGLDACREAKTPSYPHGYTGPDWNSTLWNACARLAEIALAPFTGPTLEDAGRLVFEHAPRDAKFTDALVRTTWLRAVEHVVGKPVIEPPFDLRPFPVSRDAVWGFEAEATAPASSAGETPTTVGDDGPSWAPIDLSAVLDGTFEPTRPTLMDRTDGVSLLYPGKVHSFHGESESGKSMATHVVAAAVLIAGGRVLIADFESDEHTVVGRLLGMGVPVESIRRRLVYVRPEADFTKASSEDAAWRALIVGQRYDFAVIDGVTEALSVFGRSSLDADEYTGWVRLVPRRIAEATGAAVVLVDHVTKNSDTRGRFAVGTQAKMNALTGAAYVVEVVSPIGAGMRGQLSLRVGKDRPGQIRPQCGEWRKSDRTQAAAVLDIDSTEPGRIKATLLPPSGLPGGPTEDSPEPTNDQRVITYLRGLVDPTGTQAEIAKGASMSSTSAKRAIERLLRSGHLIQRGQGKGARFVFNPEMEGRSVFD